MVLDQQEDESEEEDCDVSNESPSQRQETNESVKSKDTSNLAVRQGATGGTETARGDQLTIQTEEDLVQEPGETAEVLSDEENIRPSISHAYKDIKTAIPIVKRSKT